MKSMVTVNDRSAIGQIHAMRRMHTQTPLNEMRRNPSFIDRLISWLVA